MLWVLYVTTCHTNLYEVYTKPDLNGYSISLWLVWGEVTDGSMGIQCEGHCSSWFHCSCGLGLDLKKAQYAKLAASNEKWICPNCCGDASLPSFNSINAIDVFHFDFQKNLPTPKLTVGKQFYMRLLWTYLFRGCRRQPLYCFHFDFRYVTLVRYIYIYMNR